MKKKLLSFILVLCLIVPCAVMFSACGKKDNSKSPFNVTGKTLVGTGECMVIWHDGVTDVQKQECLTSLFGDKTLDEIYEVLKTSEMGELTNGMTIEYKADGSLLVCNTEFDYSLEGYYNQEDDLKTIFHYRDTEHTDKIKDGLGTMTYVGNGNYALFMPADLCDFAFIFELA